MPGGTPVLGEKVRHEPQLGEEEDEQVAHEGIALGRLARDAVEHGTEFPGLRGKKGLFWISALHTEAVKQPEVVRGKEAGETTSGLGLVHVGGKARAGPGPTWGLGGRGPRRTGTRRGGARRPSVLLRVLEEKWR